MSATREWKDWSTRQTTSTLWFLLDLTILKLSCNFKDEGVSTLPLIQVP